MKRKDVAKLLCAALSGMFMLSACGGGSSTTSGSGALLGDVPGIFVELAQEKQTLKQALRESKDHDERQKKLKRYDEFVLECAQESEEEAKKLMGKEVPCTGDVYDDLKVTGAKITDFRSGKETGSFTVSVMVTPKRDLTVRSWKNECAEGEYSLKDTKLYYVLMKADDHMISMGTLNPFSSNAADTKFDYESGQTIKAGEPCNREGAPVSINCHSYDYTEFAKIVFVREADYMAIRKQAYGF